MDCFSPNKIQNIFCGEGQRPSPQLVKKEFDKLVDGGASSPARCRVSNLRFEPSAVSPSAKPENPLGFQPSCHPYQFLLKSFRFPGAKTARKRFLLWKMGFSAAKILPCPPYMPLGTIEIREGFGPLERSKGFSTVCAVCAKQAAYFCAHRHFSRKKIK